MLYWLLGIDVSFVLLNIFAQGAFQLDLIAHVPVLLDIEHHRSLASFYLYLKWAALSVFFCLFWIENRQSVFLSLAVIFAGLFFDDAFELHEYLGRVLAHALSVPEFGNLIDQDRGEPIAWAAIGSVYLGILLFGMYRSSAFAREIALLFVKLFLLLAFFGIVTDFIHAFVKRIPGVNTHALSFGLGLIEDGGEMVVGSLMLVAAVLLHVRMKNAVLH